MREPDELIAESSPNQPVARPAEIVSSHTDITAITASWRAPLPPPDAFERYEEILPGSANRILEMAEKQHEHRISIERTIVFGNSRRAYLGLAAGFIISALGIGGGIYLIATGHDWAGLALAGVNLTGLVGVFVYGSKARRDERNRNAENMTE
jgi:uncharacterized membrane protein